MKVPTDVVVASLAPLRQLVSLSPTSTTASQFVISTSPRAIAVDPLQELQCSLSIMQENWFDRQKGGWPTAIDWTSSVLNTVLLTSLEALDAAVVNMTPSDANTTQAQIKTYFSDGLAYYNRESMAAFAHHAIDDMLWVALGWLEAIKFLDTHTTILPGISEPADRQTLKDAFAQRAKLFYNVASQAWDTTLCGGGILWNPVIKPYKNAITNQLYISASIGMHLHLPGGNEGSVYLDPAIKGYDWLNKSGMTNSQGLYVDGFHISGYDMQTGSVGSGKCDVRTEDVNTYNQGVVLSGLRGLYQVTGDEQYLSDGHTLISHTVAATGWQDSALASSNFAGLGRNGVLEDTCDATGTCTQNAQTFKAAYFLHLTAFCEPFINGDPAAARAHGKNCRDYGKWVEHNARAALGARGPRGRFGEWWGAQGEVDLVNNIGRGKTVEAHAGGISVVKAWQEFRRWYSVE